MAGSTISVCPHCGTKNRTPVSATGKPRCAKCKSELPWLVAADDSSLTSALGTTSLVLLDLWAPWCGPCRMVAPVLERLSKSYAGRIKVVKVNVDESPRAAMTYEAQSIPTLVLVDRGRVVDRIIGAQPEPVLVSHIDRALAAR
ncbi:MAG: thioredoxin [Candidatus Nanopelagicales bacterium]